MPTTDAPATDWHHVARASEIQADQPKAVRVGNRLIALYRIGGRFYATDNVCSHEFAELSEGTIDREYIECPLHQARFHIPTGKVVTPPATEDLAVFPVKLEGEEVFVGVPRR